MCLFSQGIDLVHSFVLDARSHLYVETPLLLFAFDMLRKNYCLRKPHMKAHMYLRRGAVTLSSSQ